MTSYWDYLKRDLRNPISSGPAGFIHALYDKMYDESHGSSRYWLSQIPVLNTNRRMRDSAQEAQDRYDNTGIDERYSTRVGGYSGSAIFGDVAGGTGLVGMARSLHDVYKPDVEEDVNPKNPMGGYY